MKQPTLQTQYQLIAEGKGNKFAFLREAKTKFPGYIPNSANFEQAVNILKTKNILNENYVDLKPINSWDRKEESYETAFKNFLKEEETKVKADSKKIAKEVETTQDSNYNNDDVKNLDNQIGQEVFNGIAFEARKNPDKTLDEIRAIVSKNLAKDKLYYLKNAAFGVEGIGYTEDVPGLKPSKSDQMQKVKLNEGLFSKNKKPKIDGTYTVEFIKGDGKGHAKVFQDPRVAKGYKDQVNSIAKDEIAIVYLTGKRPENLGDYSAKVVSVNESKSIKSLNENIIEDFLNNPEINTNKQGLGGQISNNGVLYSDVVFNGNVKELPLARYDNGIMLVTNSKYASDILDDLVQRIKNHGYQIKFVSPENIIGNNIQESKKPSMDDHLNKIQKAGEMVTLEAKINAIDGAIKKRQERIDMIGENEDLAELVHPAKLKEFQKEIKLLEKQKDKLEKLYEKMTGKKKQEIVDETEVEPEELNEGEQYGKHVIEW